MFDAITPTGVRDQVLEAAYRVASDRTFRFSAERPVVRVGDLAIKPPLFERTPPDFPKKVTISLNGSVERIEASIPARIYRVVSDSRLMAEVLGQTLLLTERESRLLVRGRSYHGTLMAEDLWCKVHLELRAGQLRVCVVTDVHAQETQAALFDPHEPAVSQPPPELIDSATLVSRLDIDCWLRIADDLTRGELACLSETGRGANNYFRRFLHDAGIVRRGARQLADELVGRASPMSMKDILEWQRAWDAPGVGDADRRFALDLLRAPIEECFKVKLRGWSGRDLSFRAAQLLMFAPRAVRELADEVREQVLRTIYT